MKINKLVKYLKEQQINKKGIVVMAEATFKKLFVEFATTPQDELSNELIKKHQINMTWEYGNNYSTFRKV